MSGAEVAAASAALGGAGLGTTTAAGMGAGMGMAGSGLALPAAGAGAGLAAGGASMIPIGALTVPGMGAQGLIAPTLAGAGTGLTAGAAEAAGMGGAQGLVGAASTSPIVTAQFAGASPDAFKMAYTVGDGVRDAGKVIDKGAKASYIANMFSPKDQNKQVSAPQMNLGQYQSMQGLLNSPAGQMQQKKLRNLGLLG